MLVTTNITNIYRSEDRLQRSSDVECLRRGTHVERDNVRVDTAWCRRLPLILDLVASLSFTCRPQHKNA